MAQLLHKMVISLPLFRKEKEHTYSSILFLSAPVFPRLLRADIQYGRILAKYGCVKLSKLM